MTVFRVGADEAFTTIAAAVAAAGAGDTVLVQAGTYVNDFFTVDERLTIKAVGGMAHLVATVAPPDGKAIVTARDDLTVRGLAFSGAAVPDRNGAGIRYEGGDLQVRSCWFHHNENGLLAGSDPDGTIDIRRSEFDHNGVSGYAHNLYVNAVAELTISRSYFHDAVVGHEIKSRALATTITGCRIQDEAGTASYSVDLPNGGVAVLRDNVFEQGAASANPAIVHFGGEGVPYARSSLWLEGNTVVNHLDSPSARFLLNQTAVEAVVTDTALYGLPAEWVASGPAAISGTAMLAVEPVLDTGSPW